MTDLELFNRLTGKNVKRFESKSIGKKRLYKVVEKTKRMRVKTSMGSHPSVKKAFQSWKFDLAKEEAFRFKLFTSKTGRATFAGVKFIWLP